MTTIDLRQIRTHNGSQDGGFEELTTQLARLDPISKNLPFIRKGVGADAGVECFIRRPDGTETGWQAKYIFGWSTSLKSQLDKSIETVLKRHPKLTEYIVCLPFDLADGRKDDEVSALQKWEEWRDHWIKTVAPRSLTISLWGKSEFVERLTREGADASGRLLYWFDAEVLTQKWFEDRFRITKAALGARYVPADNIKLSIGGVFRSFAHTDNLAGELDRRVGRIMNAYTDVRKSSTDTDKESLALLHDAMLAVSGELEGASIAPMNRLPLEAWSSLLNRSSDAARQMLRSVGERSDVQEQRLAIDRIYKLIGELTDLVEIFASDRWKAWNARSVFLTGEAGTGKSHLLGDLVEQHAAAGAPGLLVLGSQFSDDDPWLQLMRRVDFPAGRSVSTFLAALDAAAESAGTRALICVDALNENKGIEIWPHHLSSFLAAIEPFPRVAVVVSCRSAFAEFLDDAISGASELLRIPHEGFADGDGEAAKRYLEKRGIAYPGAPNLLPELHNPLFLRTICNLLDQRGLKSLPKGSNGVGSLFEAYFEAACTAVTKRMGLSPALRVPQRALAALVDEMVRSGSGYIPYPTAFQLVDVIHPSGNKLADDLIAAFVQEGIVDIEPSYGDEGDSVGQVRFTFERFSDHQIANAVLRDLPDVAAVQAFFADADKAHRFLTGAAARGIASALAIQLPERYGIEVLDLFSDGRPARRVVTPFVESLLWRDQTKFSEHTWKLAMRHLEEDGQLGIIVAISTEPDNRFNADFVFKKLDNLTLPKRDEEWSYPIAMMGYNGHVRTLIDWVFVNGLENIEDKRAELSATILTLLLSTSHRVVRDRATLALAVLLTRRLALARQIVERFRAFNDPYVRERLYAGVYGAVLQKHPGQDLGALAAAVYEIEFAGRRPTPNILVRDYAAGIVEQAAARGQLPADVEVQRVRPPFETSWRPEPVYEHEMDAFTQSYGEHVGRDSVVSSVMDGDFGRYVVNGPVNDFSISPLGNVPATMKSQFDAWEQKFLRDATPNQRGAYDVMNVAAKAAVNVSRWENDPKRVALEAARVSFESTLNGSEWESYEHDASNFLEEWKFSKQKLTDSPRTTDLRWAYRWICRRAHELGWSAKVFAAKERDLPSGDRHDHQIERVGKKYQWLALYELLAHLGDTRIFLGRGFDREATQFRGADQLGIRNIDPSLLVRKTYYEGWKQWPPTWWTPLEPRFEHADALGRLVWRDTDDDLLNDRCLFDITDPATGREYLCLHGFARWHRGGVAERRKEHQRESWYRVFCMVTRKSDEDSLIRNLVGKSLVSPDNEPKVSVDDGFVGEFPWLLQRDGEDDWIAPGPWREVKVAILPTVSEYLRERSGYDHSIDQSISLTLPAPWLADQMQLSLQGGRSLNFENTASGAEFFDPSTRQPGPQAALISKHAFLSFLDAKGLAAVWVVAGEKGVLSDHDRNHRGWGGRLVHSAVYRRVDDQFVVHSWRGKELPSKEQLQSYFENEPIPEGFDFDHVFKLYGDHEDSRAKRRRRRRKDEES